MTLCMSQSFTVWNFLLVAWIFFFWISELWIKDAQYLQVEI